MKRMLSSRWNKADRIAAAVLVFLCAYFAAATIPATWLWFDPDTPIVADTTTEAAPVIGFDRQIKRETRISYTVTMRRTAGLTMLCDPTGGPFTYRPDATLPEVIDLVWWTGGDSRCWPQEAGTYLMETCWTVVRPFWGLVPPKTVCRTSPPFRVAAP